MNTNIGRKFRCVDNSDDTKRTDSRFSTQSEQSRKTTTKKRRRGIIEKRRRDRINGCLLELKRLVPAAFEKQGSHKLEKTEILQLTVDHLKFAQSKGDCGFYDIQRLAREYVSMGFKECLNEISRYFSAPDNSGQEGLCGGFKDSSKVRLLNHLTFLYDTAHYYPQTFAGSSDFSMTSTSLKVPHWTVGKNPVDQSPSSLLTGPNFYHIAQPVDAQSNLEPMSVDQSSSSPPTLPSDESHLSSTFNYQWRPNFFHGHSTTSSPYPINNQPTPTNQQRALRFSSATGPLPLVGAGGEFYRLGEQTGAWQKNQASTATASGLNLNFTFLTQQTTASNVPAGGEGVGVTEEPVFGHPFRGL